MPLIDASATDPNMSIEEYMQKWPLSKFHIYLNYYPDNEAMDVDVDELYNELNCALEGFESIRGLICLYVVDEGTMQYIQAYVESHDQRYYDYQQMVDMYHIDDIEFEKGKLQITKEEMKKIMENR